MKLHHLIFLSVAASSLASNSLAQNLDENSADPIRHYEVELILYKNTKVPKSKEYTLPVSSPIKDSMILDLSIPSSIEKAKKMQYQVVPDNELQLTDIIKKISSSYRYETLIHTGWRQPGLKKPEVLPVWIKAGRQFGNKFISIDDKIDLMKQTQAIDEENYLSSIGETQTEMDEQTSLLPRARTNGLYEVEGKITISLSRYLHVYTDLVLRKPRRSIDPQLETVNSDQLLYENLADTRILDNHRLKEHRRMRSKTLHYLDSPEFSMLILITPYEPLREALGAVTQVEGVETKTTVSN